MMTEQKTGYITEIIGSLIKVKGLEEVSRLRDIVKILKHNILGEIIQIYSDHIIVQCFDKTMKVKLNEEVVSLEVPLSMELGPGLLSCVFDGIQRPLERVFNNDSSGKLDRGVKYPPLSRDKKWHFTPQM